jgi:DNA topoisomerase VI subunit B
MDYCSEKELTTQTGHWRDDWPLVVLKELVDNALDACEDTGTAPEIHISVDKNGIQVSDNGPGIPESTIKDVMDFSVRVSSREAYVAPDRGAQGNALKIILMIPFVLDGNVGQVEITARSIQHKINVSVSSVRQQPVIDREAVKSASFAKTGTLVRVIWPDLACSILKLAKSRFLQIAGDYTFLNPHTTLDIDWFGSQQRITATNPDWLKWRPNDPTSAHWYQMEHLDRLIAGYINHDQERGNDRTVRQFVAEFHGLTSSSKQKRVLENAGLSRVNLSALAKDHGIDRDIVASLLSAMRNHSRPVKPARLGVIGEGHLKSRFAQLGCAMESFTYYKVVGQTTDGLPYVLETAFGRCPQLEERRLITGVNWSPAIINPFRRLGELGESLDDILVEQRAGVDEPIAFLVHCVYPRAEYTDRGKSAVVTRMDGQIIKDAVVRVSKRWAKQRKTEERRGLQAEKRYRALARSNRITMKDAACQVMRDAYVKASSNGQYPAHAR